MLNYSEFRTCCYFYGNTDRKREFAVYVPTRMQKQKNRLFRLLLWARTVSRRKKEEQCEPAKYLFVDCIGRFSAISLGDFPEFLQSQR